MDYCGQEIVNLSTTPTLIDGKLVPRPFVIRAYVARTADGSWKVMPGGFARISSSGASVTSLMGAGDLSADFCIADPTPMPRFKASVLSGEPRIWRGSGILASQAADNLFWFARYIERAEATVRIVRSILGSSIEVDGSYARAPEVRASLIDLLRQWGALSSKDAALPFHQACAAALVENNLPGGAASLMRQSQFVALSLRERFARDFWRIVRRPMPVVDTQNPQSMLETAKQLIEHFSTLSGLASENMLRSLAWRFLDIGRRLERAITICRLTRRLTGLTEQSDALGVLLDLCDSQIAYRSRYLTAPLRNPVLDLVLLDPSNPRSLIFQVQRLAEHIETLPGLLDDNVPEAPLLEVRAALAPLESNRVENFGDERIDTLEARLLALSETIATRYFLQFEKTESGASESLLG
jgi:uncharacterized alpha-E superfamily protein